MKHLPDLDMIQCFLVVAEELSFRRAAGRLHLDQSAVSRRIQELERRLGLPLLLRTTREVRLTEAGRAFHAENKDLLRRLDRSVQHARRVADGEAARIRIGYMSFAAISQMPRAVRCFRTAFPATRVELTYMSTEAQKTALARGLIDCGFLIGPYAAEACSSLVAGDEQLAALLPAAHPLARRRRLGLADVAAAPLILGDTADWDFFRAQLSGLFASHGLPLRPVLEPSNSLGILGLVSAGLGVTLYPEGVRRLRLQDVVIRPIADCDMRIRTLLVWREDAAPVVGHFVTSCRKAGLLRAG